MGEYPEHEKLSKVSDVSQEIGTFVEEGMPKLGLALYERRFYDCECSACDQRKGEFSHWHTDEEKATVKDGKVQVEKWVPAHRTIQVILAEYFGIDQDKIDAEKDDMLRRLRA